MNTERTFKSNTRPDRIDRIIFGQTIAERKATRRFEIACGAIVVGGIVFLGGHELTNGADQVQHETTDIQLPE